MTHDLDSLRIDVWLDVACLFKTRSQAQKACKAGKVDVGGQRAKPHREVRIGDEIEITRHRGKQKVVVQGLAEQHIPKAEARELYEDVTPPPSPEELEVRRLEKAARLPDRRREKAPDKRERRELRRRKRRWRDER